MGGGESFLYADMYPISMWQTKFLVYDEKGVYSTRAKKFKIDIYGYPINYYSDKKYFYFVAIGFLEGEEKIKDSFIKDLEKDKRVHKIEYNKSFFICVTKETKNRESQRFVHLFYNPLLIRLKPTVIHVDGWEENEVGCFERKHLDEIFKVSEKKYKLKLKYIKQAKIENIGILNVFPKLTDKQKTAIELAVKEGYYEYPRKTEVQKLAKFSKLSFSTFQEHLRRAENKLLPFSVKKAK